MIIDRLTDIIFIPKTDMTQISSVLYELDINWLRLQLKAVEGSEEGIVFSDTHNHYTEVVLSGVTYARIFEILAPYTIEFENGPYTVRLIGGNHNIADVKVPNSVSLIVGNSAGLVVSGSALTPDQSLKLDVIAKDSKLHTVLLLEK